MNRLSRTWIIFFCFSFPAIAQQSAPSPEVSPAVTEQSAPLSSAASAASGRTDRRISLDVVVTGKSGKPVAGLEKQNFTIIDNKQPQPILSFQAVDGVDGTPAADKPAATAEPEPEILLLIDEVHLSFQGVALARVQIKKFLRQNGGQLAYPVSMIFFSDTGTTMQNGSTRDGNALAALLDKQSTALRSTTRSQGYWGEVDRRQLGLKTLEQVAAYETNQPGKKLLIWITEDWALLSGPNQESTLTTRDRQGIFNSIVRISTELQQARITLYSVDPLGTADAEGFGPFFYKDFLKGVSNPKQVRVGDLSLQVFASQSGGLVLNSSNDVSGEIERCVEDAGAFYRLTFESLPAEPPNEYHALEVRIGTPGLTARTRTGYYAQP